MGHSYREGEERGAKEQVVKGQKQRQGRWKRRSIGLRIFLPSFLSFVEVDVDASQLQLVVSDVFSGGVNAMLGGHDLEWEEEQQHCCVI